MPKQRTHGSRPYLPPGNERPTATLGRMLLASILIASGGCAAQNEITQIRTILADLDGRVNSIATSMANTSAAAEQHHAQASKLSAFITDVKSQVDLLESSMQTQLDQHSATLKNELDQAESEKQQALLRELTSFRNEMNSHIASIEAGLAKSESQARREATGTLGSTQFTALHNASQQQLAQITNLVARADNLQKQMESLEFTLKTEIDSDRKQATLELEESQTRFLCTIAILKDLMRVNRKELGDTIVVARDLLKRLQGNNNPRQEASGSPQRESASVSSVSEYCSKLEPSKIVDAPQ